MKFVDIKIFIKKSQHLLDNNTQIRFFTESFSPFLDEKSINTDNDLAKDIKIPNEIIMDFEQAVYTNDAMSQIMPIISEHEEIDNIVDETYDDILSPIEDSITEPLNEMEDSVPVSIKIKDLDKLIGENKNQDKISLDEYGYLELYELGKKTEAFNIALKDLDVILKDSNLTDNDISQLMNNTMFLSLCQNNNDHILLFHEKHDENLSSMLKSPDFIHQRDLIFYNYSLLKMAVSLINNEKAKSLFLNSKAFFKYFKNTVKDYKESLLSGLVLDIANYNEKENYIFNPSAEDIGFELKEIRGISLSLAWLMTLCAFFVIPGYYSSQEMKYIKDQIKISATSVPENAEIITPALNKLSIRKILKNEF